MLNFVNGMIIGFAIAAPVGPIGMLCIQNSLHSGFRAGLLTGLGAALADGVYGLVAALGLTGISEALINNRSWIQLVGGLFLLYLGIKLLLLAKPSLEKNASEKKSLHGSFWKTFLLTLTNPMTILSFIAILAGLGIGSVSRSPTEAILMVSGIILGSSLWWLLLSGGTAFIFHKKVSPFMMGIVNKFSGGIIILFGLFSLKQLIV